MYLCHPLAAKIQKRNNPNKLFAKKTRLTMEPRFYDSCLFRLKLYLNLYLYTAGEFEFHQGIDSLCC